MTGALRATEAGKEVTTRSAAQAVMTAFGKKLGPLPRYYRNISEKLAKLFTSIYCYIRYELTYLQASAGDAVRRYCGVPPRLTLHLT